MQSRTNKIIEINSFRTKLFLGRKINLYPHTNDSELIAR
jgi:hypothetical protein